ncbi:MAG: hypothetical protein IJ832_01360 [Bacteroidaceae bacterium]|nr:hypothetical protein [Bacteroidaceae bacterium]
MVLPYIKQGEDYRTVLENDVNKRIVLTKIKEAFDNEGFSTVDLVAKLKTLSQSAAFQEDNQKDLKAMVVEQSGADIYVEAEISCFGSSSGNSVKVIMTAYEVSSGNSLSNKVCESGQFFSTDVGALASKALRRRINGETTITQDFLSTMQMKFDEIVANGRTIVVNFGFLESSELSMDSEVGGDGNPLKDEIEMWMEDNAYKNQYHIQGTVAKSMIFDEVKIPLRDPVTGRNYNINKFMMSMRKFLRGLGLTFEENINGGVIYINFK